MKIRRIVPNISSNQLEKSKEFYSDFLGLKLVMDLKWIQTFASESNPLAQINIVQDEGENAGAQKISVSMEVSNPYQLHENAILRGYKIVYPLTIEEFGIKRFAVEDPNGVVVNLMCHIK